MFHFEGKITKKSLNIWPFPKLYIILPPIYTFNHKNL